jgi:hypothetical protein
MKYPGDLLAIAMVVTIVLIIAIGVGLFLGYAPTWTGFTPSLITCTKCGGEGMCCGAK